MSDSESPHEDIGHRMPVLTVDPLDTDEGMVHVRGVAASNVPIDGAVASVMRLTNGKADPSRVAQLVGDLRNHRCLTCHKAPANGVLHAMPGASPPAREHCGPCVAVAPRRGQRWGRR